MYNFFKWVGVYIGNSSIVHGGIYWLVKFLVGRGNCCLYLSTLFGLLVSLYTQWMLLHTLLLALLIYLTLSIKKKGKEKKRI